MSLSKPLFFHFHLRPTPFPLATFRRLSFATPEDAAAERRRRKRRLRIEPPLSHSRPAQQTLPRIPRPLSNPNAPKLPEPMSALSGKRLELHNRILGLIRENDLEEASLLTRHSIYSNCRPTAFTCNAVLNALLRQARYSDLLILHRFVTQASVPPSLSTHNIILQAYCDCRKPETALEHFRILLKDDSPVSPSPTSYRILAKGLVDASKLDLAVELKDGMLEKGFVKPDPQVYNFLMGGFVNSNEPDKALSLFEELKEKVGTSEIRDGAPYGNLMKAYFLKGMEEAAMDVHNELVVKDGSGVRFSAMSYNSVLDALGQNGKLEDALNLFDKMCKEHNSPRRITVNLGTFNVMSDAYCHAGKFDEAVLIFRKMGEKGCIPDTLSYNNLINQLGKNKLLGQAEELFKEMCEREIKPDEYTYVLLVESCFRVDRDDDAVGYFRKMVESGLRPNANAYNKVMVGLVKAGRVDDAQELFDEMPQREAKPDITSYEILLKAYIDKHRLDDAIKSAKRCLLDEGVIFTEEMKELLEAVLKKEGREDEIARLYEEVERERVEAAARAAEEKAKVEMAAREEEERKKAEAAAKEEAAARASRAAIEAILGRSKEGERGESSTRHDDVGGNTNRPNGGGGISAEQGKVPEMP
ncbi:Pentatricopeptide repeat-containing protein [Rhynchospora pubera]|uniref:Pentatricopeptide repeat-containing protein n=1 Tax=Rhynchospora pubera TaxID=906938 RepID=A0AAV8HZU7_9POAL|nr:Pentatricopeptide repeat-containing protein [Rhynchospora pubera]